MSVIIPDSEPLQAAIAERKSRPGALAYRIRLSRFMMITMLTPITLFMAAYSELIINVLLGPRNTAAPVRTVLFHLLPVRFGK